MRSTLSDHLKTVKNFRKITTNIKGAFSHLATSHFRNPNDLNSIHEDIRADRSQGTFAVIHCLSYSLLSEMVFFLFCEASTRPQVMATPYRALRTQSNHTRKDSSEWVISPSHRPLPDNTQHSQLTSMPAAGFEPAIPAKEQSQTDALDRAATGIGIQKCREL